MKSNKTKYLILILIALFFASTNELSAKEAEQNFNTESHSFIETDNYVLRVSLDVHQNTKTFVTQPFSSHKECTNSYFNLLSECPQKFIIPFIRKDLYLDISILRI
jgi:hypothetical protein